MIICQEEVARMANIRRIDGKTGISFKITVTQGRDLDGKQLRHYMTWVPEKQMTERQMQKAVEKVAFEFEQAIEQGYQIDKRQTFSEYAEYVISLKERAGVKYRTLERYRELLQRINVAIGHIKLVDIRPKHLNDFYKNLSEDGIFEDYDRAVTKIDLPAMLKERHIKLNQLAALSGLSVSTISTACQGKRVSVSSAKAISDAMESDVNFLFNIQHENKHLSDKTILEHHRLIHTILSQAEKEMIVPYNAASKATPPKVRAKEANYFQPEDIVKILEALEDEPIKWKTATHLLLITGCRRGEIMGLRWSRVDFQNSQIKIDANLLYSPKRGIYQDTTKTAGSVRFIKLPFETMQLLGEYRFWYNTQRNSAGDHWQDTDFLFVKDDGTPMIPDGITAWLRKFSERHDLPHINPHAFRHTMASILINNGKDIVSVSKRLGHAKTSTTTDLYSHIIKEADEQASECLADVLLRPAPIKNVIG